jgi:CheY-like chemotaxis protein
MLTEVFEMFTQVHRSLERCQTGLGIGLALVKRLVELHGGTVTAFSPGLGRGSTFTIRLPVEEASAGETEPLPVAAAPAPTRLPASGRRVLVVDDNVDGAESLARVLQMRGHVTRTAHGGPEGLEAARAFHPHVVLLDIGLPGMNGYEVARRLREQSPASRPVLVAITGWGTEDNKRQASEAGFDFHLTKPVDATSIESILARLATGG